MAGWNFADIWEKVADRIPDAPAVRQADRLVTWASFDKRADGIIDSPVVAVKRRGRKEPDWSIPLSGGEITRW